MVLDFNPAASGIRLLKGGNSESLSLEGDSLNHLLNYINKVKELPDNISRESNDLANAIKNLTVKASEFGSQKTIRKLSVKDPNFLLKTDQTEFLFPKVVGEVMKLSTFSENLQSRFQTLEKQGSELSAEQKNEIAKSLADSADRAKTYLDDLVSSLNTYKADLIQANGILSSSTQSESAEFRKMNEEIGKLNFQIEELKKKIENLGFFTSKKKRKNLEDELESTQAKLDQVTSDVNERQKLLKQLEIVESEGNWIELGLTNIIEFLTNENATLKTYSSGRTHLSVFAIRGEVQKPRPTWIDKAVGLKEISKVWSSIHNAAKKFVASSFVDN